MSNTEFTKEKLQESIEIIKPIFCTIFLKKKNKPLETFKVDTKDEAGVKYVLILKGFMGKLSWDTFDNIKGFLFDNWKLNQESIELGNKFDKKFRLLITTK